VIETPDNLVDIVFGRKRFKKKLGIGKKPN